MIIQEQERINVNDVCGIHTNREIKSSNLIVPEPPGPFLILFNEKNEWQDLKENT